MRQKTIPKKPSTDAAAQNLNLKVTETFTKETDSSPCPTSHKESIDKKISDANNPATGRVNLSKQSAGEEPTGRSSQDSSLIVPQKKDILFPQKKQEKQHCHRSLKDHNDRNRRNYSHYGPQHRTNSFFTGNKQSFRRGCNNRSSFKNSSKKSTYYHNCDARNSVGGSRSDHLRERSTEQISNYSCSPTDSTNNGRVHLERRHTVGRESSPRDNFSGNSSVRTIVEGSPTDSHARRFDDNRSCVQDIQNCRIERSPMDSALCSGNVNLNDGSLIDNLSATLQPNDSHTLHRLNALDATSTMEISKKHNLAGSEPSSSFGRENWLTTSKKGSPMDSPHANDDLVNANSYSGLKSTGLGSPMDILSRIPSVNCVHTNSGVLTVQKNSPMDSISSQSNANDCHFSNDRNSSRDRSPKDNVSVNSEICTEKRLIVNRKGSPKDNLSQCHNGQYSYSNSSTDRSLTGCVSANHPVLFDSVSANHPVISSHTVSTTVGRNLHEGNTTSTDSHIANVVREEVARQLVHHNINNNISPFSGNIQNHIRNEVALHLAIFNAVQGNPNPSVPVQPTVTKQSKKRKQNARRRQKRKEQSRKYREMKEKERKLEISSSEQAEEMVIEGLIKDSPKLASPSASKIDQVTNSGTTSVEDMDIDSQKHETTPTVPGHNQSEESVVIQKNMSSKKHIPFNNGEENDYRDKSAINTTKLRQASKTNAVETSVEASEDIDMEISKLCSESSQKPTNLKTSCDETSAASTSNKKNLLMSLFDKREVTASEMESKSLATGQKATNSQILYPLITDADNQSESCAGFKASSTTDNITVALGREVTSALTNSQDKNQDMSDVAKQHSSTIISESKTNTVSVKNAWSSTLPTYKARRWGDGKVSKDTEFINPFQTVSQQTSYGGCSSMYKTGDASLGEAHNSNTSSSVRGKQRAYVFTPPSTNAVPVCTNISQKQLFREWKQTFTDQFVDDRAYFRLVWTTSLSWFIAGIKIYVSDPDQMFNVMSLIAVFLVGECADVTETDINAIKNKDPKAKRDFRGIYHNLLDKPLSGFPEYRFVCAATRHNHMDRVESLGCGHLLTSIEMVRFCYGTNSDCHARFEYESEREYFQIKKEAYASTLPFIEKNVKQYPLESDDDTDSERDTDHEMSDDDQRRASRIDKKYVVRTFTTLLLTGFEVTQKCPFCKDYKDIAELFCCPVPEEHCSSKRFPDMNSLSNHAASKPDVYHKILSNYLEHFTKEYNSYVLYPRQWLPESKLSSSKIFFHSKNDYFDIKAKSTQFTADYCASFNGNFPFGNPRLLPNNQVSMVLNKRHCCLLMDQLFKYGFEATLECPFNKNHLSKMKSLVLVPKLFDRCHECPYKVFPDLQSLIKHASHPTCHFHKLLSHYLKLFDTFYSKNQLENNKATSPPENVTNKLLCDKSNIQECNVCSICNRNLPNDDVLRDAFSRVKRTISYIHTQEHIICPSCISEFLQLQRISDQEVTLFSRYTQTMKKHIYHWIENNTVINPQHYVTNVFNLGRYCDDELYSSLTRPIKYSVINILPLVDDYNDEAKKVMGVCLPNDASIHNLKPNVIACPPVGVGLIKLPRSDDFLIIEPSNFMEKSIMDMSIQEMHHISKGIMSPRAGAAGGFMVPTAKSKSMSPVTKNERLLINRKHSVALSLTYRNKDGLTKGRNAIYKDMYMRRLNCKQKFKIVLENTELQTLIVSEMISRLRSFILLQESNIMSINVTASTFLNGDDNRVYMEQQFANRGRSKLESKLLSWACSTGEMRNHMAVCAHYDGNKSHPVESMSLFGRVSTNVELGNDSLRQLEDGYLILPLDGVTVKMRCGYDILHCCLKKTVHLADNSRNTGNWSRVHGP